MAYDRYESRRGWREPRSRFAGDYGESRSSGRGWDRDDDDRDDAASSNAQATRSPAGSATRKPSAAAARI